MLDIAGWVLKLSLAKRRKGPPAPKAGGLLAAMGDLWPQNISASQFRWTAEAAKQWNVGGRRQVREPRGPTPPLLMEAAAWNGSGRWAASRATGQQQAGGCLGGRGHGPGGAAPWLCRSHCGLSAPAPPSPRPRSMGRGGGLNRPSEVPGAFPRGLHPRPPRLRGSRSW